MAKKQSMTFEEALQVIMSSEGDNPLRGMLERAVQTALECEMSEHLGAKAYERTDGRTGYRNGRKPGDLKLLVPQDRDGTFSTSLFERYQRSDKAFVLAIMEMYLKGVSTRKVADITERLCGKSFSSQQVSRLARELDDRISEWSSREPSGDYPYLIADARYEKVRAGGRVVSMGILVVLGVNERGMREVPAVEAADTENATTWSDLFKRLKKRGLGGVLLVTSDDHEGIKAAVRRHFQGSSWQRCQFHFLHNVLPLAAKGQKKQLHADLRAIFDAPDRPSANRRAEEVLVNWMEVRDKIADRLNDEICDCLACPDFPAPHRKRIRTANAPERLNQEIKRRAKVARIFPNEASALRLITALAIEQSEERETGRQYLDASLLEEWDPDEREWPFDELPEISGELELVKGETPD